MPSAPSAHCPPTVTRPSFRLKRPIHQFQTKDLKTQSRVSLEIQWDGSSGQKQATSFNGETWAHRQDLPLHNHLTGLNPNLKESCKSHIGIWAGQEGVIAYGGAHEQWGHTHHVTHMVPDKVFSLQGGREFKLKHLHVTGSGIIPDTMSVCLGLTPEHKQQE